MVAITLLLMVIAGGVIGLICKLYERPEATPATRGTGTTNQDQTPIWKKPWFGIVISSAILVLLIITLTPWLRNWLIVNPLIILGIAGVIANTWLLFREKTGEQSKAWVMLLTVLVLIAGIVTAFWTGSGKKGEAGAETKEQAVLHLGGGHYDKNPIKVPDGAKQKILQLPAKTVIRETLPEDARGWNIKDALMSDGVTAWREGRDVVISSSINVPDEITFNWW